MNALPVARLFGFEIRIHVSWIVILAILVVSVATRLESIAPDLEGPVRWALGAAVGGAFLLSALAHELGHAIVARRAGIAGGTVVVYFTGGAAPLTLEARRPRDEIAVALAGPLVSLLVGAIAIGVVAAGATTGPGPLADLAPFALIVGGLNLALGALNLLPAYPLDGGRVIRGVGWARTGDPVDGLRLVARTGRGTGIALAIIGLALVVLVDPFNGLMVALCGWFVVSAAGAVDRAAQIDLALGDVRAGDVMDRDVSAVPAGLTLDTFADQLLADGSMRAWPVTRDGELLGMLGASQIRRVARDRWPDTRAEDLAVGGDALPEVAPETTLRVVRDELGRSGLDALPVLEAGSMAGVITRRAVFETVRDRLAAVHGGPDPRP